ncbi:MAG: hypothetical protein A4E28_02656 [Methanocella sp. PtaU1.Bin125]|nr:MAG: hypothetical protein A4E28_02656 [Methanocella sp. PtaU1.Bin125]
MSQLTFLITAAIVTGIIVGLTAYFPMQIPAIYSIILGFATFVTFFFVILWTNFVFMSRAGTQ